MPNSDIIVYGANWCGDCRRAKHFLDQHNIPYRWVDIDRDRAGEALVKKLNRGNRSIPTIIFPDGTMLVEPSNEVLAGKFGVELALA